MGSAWLVVHSTVTRVQYRLPYRKCIRIGDTTLKLEPGVDIQDLTIRELLALAKRLRVDPVTLLPERDPEHVTTTRGATS